MFQLAATHQNISEHGDFVDTRWLKYFDPSAAAAAVEAHVESLPSSRTPERHTHQAYKRGLAQWVEFAGMAMPTPDLINRYIGVLVRDRKLASQTIASKYLAPLRLFLKALAGQHIIALDPLETQFITQCREQIRAAAEVKAPRDETTTNIAPLWRPEFTRLTHTQVNAMLRQIDATERLGARDYAILLIAFESGLRIAEIHRITPNSLTRSGDDWLITVRGKRSNTDPVPVSDSAAKAIQHWIDLYNAGLDADDPRIIAGDVPVFQSMMKSGSYATPGKNGFSPMKGMSIQALRDVIQRRAIQIGVRMSAHDTRRTAAAIAYDRGMPLTDIQALLRHKDAGVTLRYIGTKPDYQKRKLANYVQFG